MKANTSIFFLSTALAVITSGVGAAATVYNFESEAVDDFFSGGGVTGWTQDQPNPSIIGTQIPLAYINTATFAGTSSNAGYLGTLRGNLTPNATTTLSGAISGAGSLAGSRLSVNFAIADNAGDTFMTRDSFQISITDNSSATIAQLLFTPDAGDTAIWNLWYSLGGGALISSASTAIANSGYFLDFLFTFTAASISYGTATTGTGTSVIGTGVVPGFSDFEALNISHIPTGAPGSSANALVFDNVVATIPEPSSAALLALAALGLIRRRRS